MDSVIVSQDQSVLISSQEVDVVTTSNPEVVVTGIMGPPGISGSITQSPDVDATNLINGSTLVYSTVVEKWVATTLLENQILESGQF